MFLSLPLARGLPRGDFGVGTTNTASHSCGNDRIGTHDPRHTLPLSLPLSLPLFLALVGCSHTAVDFDSLTIRKATVSFLVHHPTSLHSGFLVRYPRQLQSICITSARQQRSDICRKEKSSFNRIAYLAKTEASYSACFVPARLLVFRIKQTSQQSTIGTIFVMASKYFKAGVSPVALIH